jgi:ABC-type amino acid transport system permease subunit
MAWKNGVSDIVCKDTPLMVMITLIFFLGLHRLFFDYTDFFEIITIDLILGLSYEIFEIIKIALLSLKKSFSITDKVIGVIPQN